MNPELDQKIKKQQNIIIEQENKRYNERIKITNELAALFESGLINILAENRMMKNPKSTNRIYYDIDDFLVSFNISPDDLCDVHFPTLNNLMSIRFDTYIEFRKIGNSDLNNKRMLLIFSDPNISQDQYCIIL